MTIFAPPGALTSGKTEQVAQLLEQHVKKIGYNSCTVCINILYLQQINGTAIIDGANSINSKHIDHEKDFICSSNVTGLSSHIRPEQRWTVLLSKAVGEQLTCVFVDHGLLRKNEGDEVEAVFGPNGNYDLHFIRLYNAKQHKRQIINFGIDKACYRT